MSGNKSRRIALAAVGLIVIALLFATLVFAVGQSSRRNEENETDIIENLKSTPGGRVLLARPGFKAELKKILRSMQGREEQSNDPEIIEFPVAETVDFSDYDFPSVDLIVIKDSRTGETVRVEDADKIDRIISFIRTISGSSPVSSRGYSGGYFYLELFSEDSEVFEIGFVDGDSGGPVFTYGVFEEANGFRYPCRYRMTGCKLEDVIGFFPAFFE